MIRDAGGINGTEAHPSHPRYAMDALEPIIIGNVRKDILINQKSIFSL